MATVNIMELEAILAAFEADPTHPLHGRNNRNPEWYYFSVFGEPSRRGTWGWRVEGHHVSLHFTAVDGTVVASTPAFLGSNGWGRAEPQHRP